MAGLGGYETDSDEVDFAVRRSGHRCGG